MLSRVKSIFINISIAGFCQSSDQFGRKLTRSITLTKNDQQLKTLIKKYQGSFNMYNLTALLKQINKISRNPQTVKLAYNQVLSSLDQIKSPTRENSRAIANIISYAGGQNYRGLDAYIKSLDFYNLFRFLNKKQFVMAFTGLCKLNLLDHTIKKQNILPFLKEYMPQDIEFGLLISLWRNLIKSNLSSAQINTYITGLLSKLQLSHNLKDFGYLIYCYTKTYNTFDSGQVLKMIQACSQQILYTTKLTMQQLCIIVDHLVVLRQLTKFSPTKQFIVVLIQQYTRNVQLEKKDLRTLANGYLSMDKLIGKTNYKIYTQALTKFDQIIQSQGQNINDFESITSLFLQIITDRPQKQDSQQITDNQNINQETLKQDLHNLYQQILFLLYDKSMNKIHKLNDKQLQKMLYGFYLYKKQIQNINFEKIVKQKTVQTILNRQNLTDIQLNSLRIILNYFDIKDERVCQHFAKLIKKQQLQKEKQQDKKNSQFGCLLNYPSSVCLKCLLK